MSCSVFAKQASGSGGILGRERSRQTDWLAFLVSSVMVTLLLSACFGTRVYAGIVITITEKFGGDDMAVDGTGNLYIVDSSNGSVFQKNVIQKIDTDGNVSIVAGNGTGGFSGDGGPATSAQLAEPSGIAVDSSGNLYIADAGNYRIRKVDTAGNISTVVSDHSPDHMQKEGDFWCLSDDCYSEYGGFMGDGQDARAAYLDFPLDVAADNDGNLYIVDNDRIRKVFAFGDGSDRFGKIFTIAKGRGRITIDNSGNLYLVAIDQIYKMTTTGQISVVAGNGTRGFSGDGGAATNAQLYLPTDIAVDSSGNLYIADTINDRIRKVDTAGNISTIAQILQPYSVAVDSIGNLYIANLSSIRRVVIAPCGSNLGIKIWIDKNGNRIYDTGEEVSDAAVWVNNTRQTSKTDANGTIRILATAPDKIYAEKTFFSVENPKAVDSNFGGAINNPYAINGIDYKAYNFVMASDVMRKLDGQYRDIPTNGEICGSEFKSPRDKDGNVLVQLVHPKIEWNLVVAFQEEQTPDFYDQIRTGFRSYADYMYNYTDGYSVVKNVVLLTTSGFEGTSQWDYSDVQVKNDVWPYAHIFGNRSNDLYHIHMGRTWSEHEPTGYNWYSTLGHESGHYLFGFRDEYRSGNGLGGQPGEWTYRETHDGDQGEPNEFPKNYGVMDHQYTAHELSDTTDYFLRGAYTLDQVTMQYDFWNQSTWDFLRAVYQSEIQSEMSGQGFSSAFFDNLIIPPHLVGSYPHSDSTKRAGPDRMNRDGITFRKADRGEERNEVNFIEWTSPSNTRTGDREPLFDATVQVVDSSRAPIPQAEVWLVSAEGIKHLQGKTNHAGEVISNSVRLGKRLEAYSEGRKTELTVTEKTDHYLLTISSRGVRDSDKNESRFIVSAQLDNSQPSKLVIDVSGKALNLAPSVILSQPESYVATVPMESQANDSYSGLTESQYYSGSLEVISADNQSISAFEIFSTDVSLSPGFPAPNGELLMVTTSDSFVGSGQFVITTSTAPAPANDDLVQVGDVWSFDFSSNISAVRNVGFEVLLSADRMKGLDATQLNLYGWNAVNKHWQFIAGGGTRDLKSFNIALESLDYVSYALFAPVSEDTVAPNAITDLQASTGDSRWRINLQWTAPSDDRGIHIYEIRFNTVPVTEDNWNDSFAIRTIPQNAVETFIMEMPDPNKDYYFAIRSADSASNWSSMGTLNTPTKSQSSDTDEDGMLDKWEIKYFGDLSHDGTADTDSDLFTDLEEFEAGTDPATTVTVELYSASGILTDKNGQPITGATLQIGDQTVTTDANGYWEIPNLPKGEYVVIVTKAGYGTISQAIEIGKDQPTEIKFILSSLLKMETTYTVKELGQGNHLTYTITITNTGTEIATGLVFTDTLPKDIELLTIKANSSGQGCHKKTASCELPDLAPNATIPVELVVQNKLGKEPANYAQVSSDNYPVSFDIILEKLLETVTTPPVETPPVMPYLSVSLSDTPDPIPLNLVQGEALQYTAQVNLDTLVTAPASGVKLKFSLPNGLAFKAVNTDKGTCDSSGLPMIACQLTDLDVGGRATVMVDTQLQDLGLMALTADAEVSADNYPPHTDKERTTIQIPAGVEVDMAFVVDDTGSMQGEIDATVKALEEFIATIKPEDAPLIAFLTFKDEVTVKFFGRDLNLLLKTVKGLKASGGGMCPEASVEALNAAIPHVKRGGSILFVTDASPYDDADLEKLAELLQSKAIRLNSIVTGDCSDQNSWNSLEESQ